MPAIASRGKGRRTMNDINMVPFIDVMLVLLIIFMVTAPMLSPGVIDVPSVGQAARQPDRFVQVIITTDARLQIKEGGSQGAAQDVTLEQLAAQVQALQGPTAPNTGPVPVVIAADKNVKYDTVVHVMDTLQRAGIARVGLSVQPQP
ncbi:ExbD/TolR family protein [Macromonas bipunctata]|uniref:ExbD/TolR family protein n=1 Tax=Macromonas bipunctata TaxID=183670 RepID=UPI000C3460CE|nr:ExbD/TolR family protein [Macromonas bipunctata]